jgi:hypothetical protein
LSDATAPVNGRIATLGETSSGASRARRRRYGPVEAMTMGKSLSVLALIAGLALAVTMHRTERADPPQPGPDLPALAQIAPSAGPAIGGAWPARDELAGLPTGCAACLPADFQAPGQWQAEPSPELAGGNSSSGLRIGLAPPPSLARLQAAPPNMAGNPLLMPGQDAGLNDGPRLEFAPAPEPHNWAMFIVGMALVGGRLRRRQRPYLATL